MQLDRDTVDRIAHLARLQLDDDEAAGYARHLSDILDFVAQLDDADTSATEPLAHPLEVTQRLREDAVTEPDQRARFQALAPAVEDGLYLVPKVLD